MGKGFILKFILKEEMRLEVEIKAAHSRTRQTYGAERLQHELAAHGVTVGVCRFKRIRRKLGLRCRQKRKFRVTTDSNHSLPVAGNILKQQFKVYKPDAVWVSDITYVPTDEGFRLRRERSVERQKVHFVVTSVEPA